MKKTLYLYGIKAKSLEGMEYFQALQYKLDNAKETFKELYNITNAERENKTREELKEISDRLFFVQKAIVHTEHLLGERKDEWD